MWETLIGRNMFTSDNIKLSEVIFIWFLALSSTLYPALIEFVGFCFICSFCLSFLLPGMIGLLDLKTILALSSTSYGCAVYRSVGQWQKFIHYKHVSDYHKLDWCLPWAFPEVCFLFLIITNIGYSGILLPLFKSAYSELFYLSEHIRFRMHYHLWAESFQDCICLLFFIFIGNKMMIR